MQIEQVLTALFSLFGLVNFYGISTTIDDLMPKPFLDIKSVLFQTIQFSISRVLCLILVKC